MPWIDDKVPWQVDKPSGAPGLGGGSLSEGCM